MNDTKAVYFAFFITGSVQENSKLDESFASSSSLFLYSHGNKEVFSCWGIQLAVDWFRERGHTYIKVFVPLWRKEPPRQDSPIAGGSHPGGIWQPLGAVWREGLCEEPSTVVFPVKSTEQVVCQASLT